VNALTVLITIKAGRETALKQLLLHIQSDPARNEIFQINEDMLTHCARWTVIHDADNGYRLLISTEFDGDLDSYLAELLRIAPGIDKILDNCEGYPGRNGFNDFIRRNYYETQAFYIAFRDETVCTVRDKIQVREQLENFLDSKAPWLNSLLIVLAGLPVARSLGKSVRQSIQWARTAFHDFWLGILLDIIKPITQLGQTKNYPRVTDPRDAQAGRHLSRLDGQMITITEVKPFRYPRLRLALAANEFLGKYGYAPGQFANVGTLHSFRWIVIDNRKRIIFLSVFDGSWQNYMGDFIDKIIWALDGVYNNTKDYPPGGMTQIDAFKAWILRHQYEPQLLFKSYPEETVLNLIRDRKINQSLADQLYAAAGFDSEEAKVLLRAL
jgi:hypothetical protein